MTEDEKKSGVKGTVSDVEVVYLKDERSIENCRMRSVLEDEEVERRND